MFESFFLFSPLSFPLGVVTTDPWLWNLFLFLLILGTSAAGVLLYVFSSTPENWQHTSVLTIDADEDTRYTELTRLIQASSTSPLPQLKQMMQSTFLEKVRLAKGMTSDSFFFFREHDPGYFRKLIADDELYDWLFFDHFASHVVEKGKQQKNKHQRFLSEMQMMMKKMEAWET